MASKWVHKLSNINVEDKTADCANCGPVPIKVTGTKKACLMAVRERARKTIRTHPRKGISHGLSIEQAARIRENAECWICQSTTKLVVDHCHSTGVIRGVLCNNCNTGLGMFKDDTERMARGIEYLSNPPGVPSDAL